MFTCGAQLQDLALRGRLNEVYVPHNLGICAILRLCSAFSESGNCVPILRLRTRFMQSQDCAALVCNLDRRITVACTIESFDFPSCTKVRNVCNELLQLRCHHQCWTCILKPPHQGLLGSLPTQRNSLRIPLSLGTGAERSKTCVVPPFKASQFSTLFC